LGRALERDDVDDDEPIERRSGLGGLGASNATAHRAIRAGAIRRLGDTEMNRQKSATQLIREVPVAARKRLSDAAAKHESFARRDINIEFFVREVHESSLAGLTAAFALQAKVP
jgi:hypothetical protein